MLIEAKIASSSDEKAKFLEERAARVE